jgi:hypothetical protein
MPGLYCPFYHCLLSVHLVYGTPRHLHQALNCLCCTDAAERPQAVVDIFFSSEGINSADLAEQRAANLAISSAMADAPTSIYPALHSALTKAIDHKEHDSISPTEVKIFFTPAGTHAPTLQDASAPSFADLACYTDQHQTI